MNEERILDRYADNLTEAEYITNPYLVEEINDKYKDLEYEISKLDANLTEAITNAKYKIIAVYR